MYNRSNIFPNANNPPYGYNDNNFNRQSVPSNIYPSSTHRYGDPMSNYNPITTNSGHLNNTTRFDKAYNNNNPIIERPIYENNNSIIHNNIGQEVLDETITEYKILIDSADRDIKTYNNPFDFVVKFGAMGGGIVRYNNYKKGELVAENKYIPAMPLPYINREFKNIKYIKLETVVLPIGDKKSFCLLDDRYISLVINEIENNTIYSTGDNSVRYDINTNKTLTPPKPFAIIFPDKLTSKYHFTGTPFYGLKTYKSSQLGNISSMSIKFTDSYGFPLKFDNLYTYDQIQSALDNGNEIFITNDRHPLNRKYQLSLSLIIGVTECQITTNTKYEK
jgi:hypothetical protein